LLHRNQQAPENQFYLEDLVSLEILENRLCPEDLEIQWYLEDPVNLENQLHPEDLEILVIRFFLVNLFYHRNQQDQQLQRFLLNLVNLEILGNQ
jgi:hypothetical protein